MLISCYRLMLKCGSKHLLISAPLFAVKFIIQSTHPFFWLLIPIKHWAEECQVCSGPSGSQGAACEELATAAVLLLCEFPVPEPSPPSHCDIFASGYLLESVFQSPARKSVVRKQVCVSASMYAETVHL